jgi:GT2 family glycosyltransferase/glycosyltransferase involved in cell wall biosynthesis
MSPDAYRQQLLAPLRRGAAPRLGELPARIWFRPEAREKPVGLKDLYDAGVRSGHGASREYLEARVASVDGELAEARARLMQTRDTLANQLTRVEAELADARRTYDRHEREFQQAVDGWRNRVRELEGSTFWRMTSPLRAVAHRGKAAMRYALALPTHARLLKPRLATARQIAKDEGTVELLRRIRSKVAARARPLGLTPRPGLEGAIRPLHVASSDKPRVSVIVPTYGEDLHTFTCLKALAGEASRVALEVIVMDDCAPQPAAEALRQVTGVRFERNATNLGFVGNCNRGAALARGDYLLILNNDAVLGAGALEALLDVFARFPRAGAAGAKLVYPDGRLQEAGAIVWRDGSAWNDGRGDDPERPEYNYLREADYCSAACLLVPKALFDELGGFDERYSPAYCEDVDLCFRLREEGRKVYYQPAAEVVHFEGASHGTDLAHGIKRHQVENQARFAERWSEALASHRVNGALPRLERDRAARRRILLIEACMLTPDQDAGSVRTWRLIKVMQEMGSKVTFVAANLEQREPYHAQLQQEGVEVLYAPYVRSIEELVKERGAEFDIIILARYYIAGRYIDAVRRHAPRALLVFDTIDLHYLRNRRLAHLEKNASLAQGAEAIYRHEIDCIQRCDVTWVVSEIERDILAREVPRACVLVQTMIHAPAPPRAGFAEREGLLFLGGFRHPPNVDAARYLAREIVPRLRQRLPDVTTYVVGANAPKAVLELAAPGLEVVGFVPDLAPWFERCRASVSPLRYGAGIKGKVNHAMSHGLPVVATHASIEGMHLAEGEEVLVADDPDVFVDAVVRLYGDEALWKRLSCAGIANVERHFSAQVAARGLERLFEIAERRVAATTPRPRVTSAGPAG